MLDEIPTPTLADHPLVASFHAAFEADDATTRRETISGLTDPHWWKQKVSRWRGAATDAEIVGADEVWLCAGGLRAEGDRKDFYTGFMNAVRLRGAGPFLPTAEDRRYQAVEEKLARFAAWIEQIRVRVMIGLHDSVTTTAGDTVHLPVPFPARVEDPLAHLTLDVERIHEEQGELVELVLTVHVADHGKPSLLGQAVDAARSVINPIEDEWRLLPGRGADQVWSTLVTEETLASASNVSTTGLLPDHLRDRHLALDVQAHYTRRDSIVDATVDGDAVRGLCGRWFVPTASPEALAVCPICESRVRSLDA